MLNQSDNFRAPSARHPSCFEYISFFITNCSYTQKLSLHFQSHTMKSFKIRCTKGASILISNHQVIQFSAQCVTFIRYLLLYANKFNFQAFVMLFKKQNACCKPAWDPFTLSKPYVTVPISLSLSLPPPPPATALHP